LDTGIFALAVGAVSTMPPPVRCLQTLTAAAVVFAILGACGLPPPRRGTPVVIRPRRPATGVTIRSLTGDWEAVHGTPAGPVDVRLALVQSGDTLQGTLRVGDRILASDATWPARLDTSGRFVMVFGQSHEIVGRARLDASGDWFSMAVAGLAEEQLSLIFQRR
jgi:hypothetical protein